MEVLNLELLDAISEDAIHLAHVDQLVVDLIDAASRIITICTTLRH